jgi:thioredoxin 1
MEFFMVDSLVKHVTDVSFDQDVLQSCTPVLVDFWAPWCGPCRMVGPILDEISTIYDGKIVIAKLNVDENQQTPVQYGIRGIPTMILFKEGKAVSTKVGALPRAQLASFIDENLA